ncbi:2'-5' RNA ligase family protein [Asaia prunellae]|uniref:2'-5' RNA ligase family protein n=1 Tax=Asaia prunellae TaxID=610245 RepID=UPI0034E2B21D
MPAGALIREAICASLPADSLTRQDQSRWRPHLTVQNKVSPEQARTLHAQLSAEPPRAASFAAALNLWRYLGGPWKKIARVAFAPPESVREDEQALGIPRSESWQ